MKLKQDDVEKLIEAFEQELIHNRPSIPYSRLCLLSAIEKTFGIEPNESSKGEKDEREFI